MNIVLQGNNDENLLRILNKSIYETIDDYLYEKYSNENTMSSYRSYITRHVKRIDFQKLQDLNHIHYIDIRKSIVAFIKSFSSANTKRVVISCLRGFWNYLCDVYGYKKNPVPAKMNLPPRQSKSITKSLTFDKIKHLLDKLQSYTKFGFCDHVKYVLTATLATTGLRISEVLQITTSMVEEGCISIVQKRGKTRKLELPPQTQKALWDFICLYDIKGGVFQTSTRQVMGRVYAHRIVKKATGISPHGFRKSVIEMLIDKGIHNHEVAKVSGHSSINMVFYYDNRDTVAEAHKGLAMDLLK